MQTFKPSDVRIHEPVSQDCYRASYLYCTGGIDCGDVIQAADDATAPKEAHRRPKANFGKLFGLQRVEVTDDGSTTVIPVPPMT